MNLMQSVSEAGLSHAGAVTTVAVLVADAAGGCRASTSLHSRAGSGHAFSMAHPPVVSDCLFSTIFISREDDKGANNKHQ